MAGFKEFAKLLSLNIMHGRVLILPNLLYLQIPLFLEKSTMDIRLSL